MKKPAKGEYNPYFERYIGLVPEGDYPEGDYIELLKKNSKDTADFFEGIPAAKHDYRYAEGKWSIKEILNHIIDTERVMVYRALVAARGDRTTILHNMDENMYAANADVSGRTLEDLLEEFKALRRSTEKFFENLTEKASSLKANTLSGLAHYPITARAVGYVLIGHTSHHINTIKERYLDGN